MGAAINSCLSENFECYLFGNDYATTVSIVGDNVRLEGTNAQKAASGSRIVGLSASLAASAPLVSLGRSSVIEHVEIRYDSITGSEAQDERVGLDTGANAAGTSFDLQRGSYVGNVRIRNVGTAIGDMGSGGFSIHFGPIEISDFSYAGVDMRAQGGTGNSWDNIYITGDFEAATYTPTYGFNCEQGMFGSAQQINVEHCQFEAAGAAFRLKNVVNANINNLHLEGIDTDAVDGCYLEFDEASARIETLNIINTRATYDNLHVVRLMNTNFRLDTLSPRTTHNYIDIGTMHVVGIAAPNGGLYPSYAGNAGIHEIANFQWFGRSSGYTNKEYEVGVHNWEYGIYAGDSSTDALFYQYPDTRYSNENNNIRFLHFDGRGELDHPRRNYVKNGAFDTWASTDTGYVTVDTECATGWFVNAGTGTIRAQQMSDEFGNEDEYYIRFDNTSSTGTFDGLTFKMFDYRALMGETVTLSFEMRCSNTGTVLNQIAGTFTNTGGTPTSNYIQFGVGSVFPITTADTWTYFEREVTLTADSDITTYGSAPYHNIYFALNSSGSSNAQTIDLRRVKVEKGTRPTRFIRHPLD
jgi:hypothetical protein